LLTFSIKRQKREFQVALVAFKTLCHWSTQVIAELYFAKGDMRINLLKTDDNALATYASILSLVRHPLPFVALEPPVCLDTTFSMAGFEMLQQQQQQQQ
jgi:hypothetical protein